MEDPGPDERAGDDRHQVGHEDDRPERRPTTQGPVQEERQQQRRHQRQRHEGDGVVDRPAERRPEQVVAGEGAEIVADANEARR
jgi:hypothetical protein